MDDKKLTLAEGSTQKRRGLDFGNVVEGFTGGVAGIVDGVTKGIQKAASDATRAAGPVADSALATIADTADDVAGAAAELGNAVNEWAYRQQMDKYRPVKLEDYQSPSFVLPNLIRIVDGNERRGIEVCKGAIGWLDSAKGTQVLNLYREAIKDSELSFYPKPSIRSIYYVDAFDRSRFVDLDSYFATMQQDKMAELRRIAFMLGAKRCKLEVSEYEETRQGIHGRANIGAGKKASLDANGSSEFAETAEKKVLFTQEFEGDMSPQRPELNWYAHDSDIKLLIDTRCGGEDTNKATNYKVELKSETTMTMSISLASAIDEACTKLKIKSDASLTSQARREHRQTFVFEIDF